MLAKSVSTRGASLTCRLSYLAYGGCQTSPIVTQCLSCLLTSTSTSPWTSQRPTYYYSLPSRPPSPHKNTLSPPLQPLVLLIGFACYRHEYLQVISLPDDGRVLLVQQWCTQIDKCLFRTIMAAFLQFSIAVTQVQPHLISGLWPTTSQYYPIADRTNKHNNIL